MREHLHKCFAPDTIPLGESSILQGGCMGLHLLETTTAELVGELNRDNVMSLLAEGRLAVVDTSPADRFKPYAGGIGVSAPSAGEHGCQSMALAAATMVGERAFKMGEACSLVVAVTGMNVSDVKSYASIKSVHMSIPTVTWPSCAFHLPNPLPSTHKKNPLLK